MNELHDLLERATDRVAAPDLAASALVAASRRRTVQRTLLAGSVAAVVVVSVAVVSQVSRSDSDGTPPVSPPITVQVTTPVTPPATDVPTQTFDPRRVDELPYRSIPSLPQNLNWPSEATPLEGHPIDAAVLAMYGTDSYVLLGTDGSWRGVPDSSQTYYPDGLSPDGTRFAVETKAGVDVWTLSTGTKKAVAWPDGEQSTDFSSWLWLGDSTLLFDDAQSEPGAWRVDVESGRDTHISYSTDWWSRTVDDDGALVESTNYGRPAQLVDWASGQPRYIDAHGLGHLTTLRARSDTVVGIGGATVFVLDRADATPKATLQIYDPPGNHSDGKLPVVGLLNDGTVLMQVPVFPRLDPSDFSWRIVAWNPSSGDLSVVCRADGSVPASYATRLLG